MTRQTKSSNNTNDVEAKFNGFSNCVVLRGEVKRILLDSDKVNKYSLAVPSKTAKGNVSYAFINLTEFCDNSEPYEVGSLLHIEGHIATGSYEKNGKKMYTTDIIADKIEEI